MKQNSYHYKAQICKIHRTLSPNTLELHVYIFAAQAEIYKFTIQKSQIGHTLKFEVSRP